MPNWLGGKTYFFVNYEGRRFPQSTTNERLVPTATLRAGIITQNGVAYNINPYPVTVNGTTYAACAGQAYCDPRGIGMNADVRTIWTKYMPLPNDPSAGDGVNTQGYLSSIALPQKSDFGVVRIDHDFGSKNHFMSTYRYYNFSQDVTTQTDIGGILCGSVGQTCSSAFRPQKPWYLVFGLTTSITPNTTNDLHVSYLRNFWQWYTAGAPPQLPGLGAALEIGGEFLSTGNVRGASRNALIPYNVNTQDTRQRFWDGKDKNLRDDVNSLHGNHLIQFGGAYQRNYDYHLRNDNGAGIDVAPTYQIANDASAVSITAPQGVNTTSWGQYYTEILGIVSQAQVMYSRAGSNLSLQPLGTPLFDQDIVPTYDLYVSDTWHARKDLTLTYGLSYSIEMPPYEVNGKQVELVDTSGKVVSLPTYLTDLDVSARNGVSYNPLLGSETIRNVPAKYPFQPFYGGLSPRISAAWNPSFTDGLLGKLFGNGQTVIRGGYSRIYGRLNGVGLVLIPLLGTGLAQTDICAGPLMGGGCSPSTTPATPANAFRIGTDGNSVTLPPVSQTLPHPYYGGVNGQPATGVSTYIDPNLKPDRSDEFNFSIQRAISQKALIEVGYIGRRIRDEFQQINLDAVPINYTLAGQSFANAFANTYLALSAGGTPSPQPFFEAALGGPNSPFCAGKGSCTAAIAGSTALAGLITTPQVYTLWHTLSGEKGWSLGSTMPSTSGQVNGATFMNSSLGWGNYNALYLSATIRDWHGMTARSNFTWGRAMGTQDQIQATSEFTALNPFDLHAMYGSQPFDVRFTYNLSLVYQLPWFKDQKGVVGRILGGWSIAPLFTAQSGYPIEVNLDSGCDCESFGEVNPNGGATTE
ncbi:MAG: hypothetical protein JO211_12105, partial [Acidobacteriaceae bacterium]|nr:hypothetical protein [Acidobacteriaceae bacterium]